MSENEGPLGLVSFLRLQSRHREAIGGSLLLCRDGVGGVCQHTRWWQLQKGTGVSRESGWGSPGSVLCSCHPYQPLFPVCAHMCTHIRTHATFQLSVPQLGRTRLPWALALARPAGEGVAGTSPGLAPEAGCIPIGSHWMPALDRGPAHPLGLSCSHRPRQLIKLSVAESRRCSLLIP